MMTRYGQLEIANRTLFSRHPNGFGISPYLQEQLVFLGQLEVYQQAAEIADKLLGISIHASQIYRLTNHYGAAIAADLDQAVEVAPPLEGVVYAQADGAMLLTDDGYQENKLARIFRADARKESVVADRGGAINSSLYTAHLGSAAAFTPKLRVHLDGYQALGADLVFISDGAIWLRQLMQKNYPRATLILDLYHAMSYVGQVATAAYGTSQQAALWTENQRKLLLDSELDTVLSNINGLSILPSLRHSVCQYLSSNRDRMDYRAYRQRSLLIGSGAIESAHRTVVQKRLKRAGQRWSQPGAQRVLNLRVCQMSERWDIVRNHIEPYARAA